MVLKTEIIKLKNPIEFQEQKFNEIEVRELSFAAQLRIDSKDKLDLSDVYSECVYPKGIMEVMGREETKEYKVQILEAYMRVNGINQPPLDRDWET